MLAAMAKKKASDTKQGFTLRLQAVREDAGYAKMAPFARHLGVEEATYRAWERGDAEPNISELANIYRKTEVSLDFLIAGGVPRTSEGFPESSQGAKHGKDRRAS